jgi:Holliday junction resolvase-like predicted endonuclease
MSTQNIGEEIAGLYLQIERGCEFVEYNLYTPDEQGEIDVVAINMRQRIVYVCEVAIHLTTGLQYVKEARTDTINRLLKKFNKDIDYAEHYFRDYTRVYMFWSPVVKRSAPTAKFDQFKAVEQVHAEILTTRGVAIELIINEEFQACMAKLRVHAASKTEALKSPVLRLFQIEAALDKHVKSLARRQAMLAAAES